MEPYYETLWDILLWRLRVLMILYGAMMHHILVMRSRKSPTGVEKTDPETW